MSPEPRVLSGQRRAALPGQLAAAALIVLLGTGCSNAPAEVDGAEKPVGTGSAGAKATVGTDGEGDVSGPTGQPPSPAELQQLLKERRGTAQCMRDNGVQDFPDPDANGSTLYYGNDPDMKSAREKCGVPASAGQG